jgi:hypothetical protein
VRKISVIINYPTLTIKHKIVYFCRRFQCLILLWWLHLLGTSWRVGLRSIHTDISDIRKPLKLRGKWHLYTADTRMHRECLRQANKCISCEWSVIIDTVLSETSVGFSEHAKCLINVKFRVRFIYDICNFIYVTFFSFFVYTSLFWCIIDFYVSHFVVDLRNSKFCLPSPDALIPLPRPRRLKNRLHGFFSHIVRFQNMQNIRRSAGLVPPFLLRKEECAAVFWICAWMIVLRSGDAFVTKGKKKKLDSKLNDSKKFLTLIYS